LAYEYLRIADAANARVAAAQHRLTVDAANLGRVEGDLRAIAAAKRSFDTGLRRLAVTPALEPDIRRLLNADATLETWLDQGGKAPTVAALSAVQARIASAVGVAAQAARQLRQDLGLPSPPQST
jgi:hypothetical protein